MGRLSMIFRGTCPNGREVVPEEAERVVVLEDRLGVVSLSFPSSASSTDRSSSVSFTGCDVSIVDIESVSPKPPNERSDGLLGRLSPAAEPNLDLA